MTAIPGAYQVRPVARRRRLSNPVAFLAHPPAEATPRQRLVGGVLILAFLFLPALGVGGGR